MALSESTTDRIRRLTNDAGRPAQAPILGVMRGIATVMVTGLVVGALTREPLTAGVVALGLALAAAGFILWRLRDDRRRHAFAVAYEHYFADRDRWKAETASNLPRTRDEMLTWLERHPGASPSRATVLLALGRLDEADVVIGATEATSNREQFDLELQRQISALFAAREVDLPRLRALRDAIPDDAERRVSSLCLANFGACQAVDRGGDPMPILASGWSIGTTQMRRPFRYLAGMLSVLVIFAPICVAIGTMILVATLS